MNPFMIFKNFIFNGGTPQQVLEKMLMSNNTNPMLGNLVNMAKNNNCKGIEQFARNMCKERGKDFDQEFANFQKIFNNR